MSNIFDRIDNSVTKGTNALTKGAAAIDIGAKLINRFGNKKGQPKPDTPPPRKTDIQPLSAFIALIKQDGLAKQNNFRFIFTPSMLINLNEEGFKLIPDARKLELFCASCSMPGVNIGSSQQRTFGELYEMPNDKMYGSLTSSFYVDNHFTVKKLFDQWQENIIDKTSRTFAFYNDYTVDISIIVYDRWGMPHYEMKMYNAWPKSTNDITLANDSSEFMKLDVTWAYRKFETFTIQTDVHSLVAQPEGQRSLSMRDRLMGYVGDFKDYQHKFNNLRGDISRTKSFIRKPDFGGLVGQSFTGAKDLF